MHNIMEMGKMMLSTYLLCFPNNRKYKIKSNKSFEESTHEMYTPENVDIL